MAGAGRATTSAATGSDRIARAFESNEKRAVLMPYAMGGYPDLAASRRIVETYLAAGADVVELGVPFSDPLADGPVIQAAGERALAAGASLDSVLEQVAAPLARKIPIVLMCYANPLYTRGFDVATARLEEAGIAGLIVPDLPAEEAAELRDACDAHGVALVPLVAPTTPPDAVRAIAEAARGFVYVVSVTGVTGERGKLSPALEAVVSRVRAHASVPVAVGFGVASAEQVGQVGRLADGVIVGSRLVRAVAEAATLEEGLAGVQEFLRTASQALT
jgi:tryptophan synthase alpha chain